MTDETTAGRPARPATPELDKLVKVSAESHKLGEFLEWLEGQGLTLCLIERDLFLPDFTSINDRLAEYFKIDMDKVERERGEVLVYLRARNDEQGQAEAQTRVRREETS